MNQTLGSFPSNPGGAQTRRGSLPGQCQWEKSWFDRFLACENTSRLAAMQRAEKNIVELLENFARSFHRLRQTSIDEELFDVISGFEALMGPGRHA